MAHHAVLLDVGPRRVHPLPGLQGRGNQAVLPVYNGALLNDFVLERDTSGTKLRLLSPDLDKWKITFVDTGLNANIAERLKAVAPHLGDDETFLATYGDGLTDAPLPAVIETFHESRKTAVFLSVKPQFNAHVVSTDGDGNVPPSRT